MERDWRVRDISDCDLEMLPEVISWPSLCSQAEAVERLVHMGALEDLVIKNILSKTPRGVHALPLSENVKNIESSSLKLPWWIDVKKSNSLLPGLFETGQIFQMMEIESGDKILLIGPRGNWWTEIIMHMGVSKIKIIEIDQIRKEVLKNRWENLRLDIVAKALNCDIEWGGLEFMELDSEERWDKILITGGLTKSPINLLKKLKENGEVWVPIGEEHNTILQRITKIDLGDLQSQYIAMWDVDMLEYQAENVLCNDLKYQIKNNTEAIEESADVIREAWLHANDNPTRDRLGPASLLEIIGEVWKSTDILLENDNITLKDSLAKDLFRMGHVLQKIGIFRLAAEHHGASYSLSPSAESACYLGMTYSLDEEDSLAWQRKAIETDPHFGESWNEIGEILMKKGDVENSINWFREAIVSKNYSKRGSAWANLTRAHIELEQEMSAFFAAQKAVELFPDDKELIELLYHLGENLV